MYVSISHYLISYRTISKFRPSYLPRARRSGLCSKNASKRYRRTEGSLVDIGWSWISSFEKFQTPPSRTCKEIYWNKTVSTLAEDGRCSSRSRGLGSSNHTIFFEVFKKRYYYLLFYSIYFNNIIIIENLF